MARQWSAFCLTISPKYHLQTASNPLPLLGHLYSFATSVTQTFDQTTYRFHIFTLHPPMQRHMGSAHYLYAPHNSLLAPMDRSNSCNKSIWTLMSPAHLAGSPRNPPEFSVSVMFPHICYLKPANIAPLSKIILASKR